MRHSHPNPDSRERRPEATAPDLAALLRSEGGFTLMEMIVVLAIVASLMGLMLYGMGALGMTDLRDSAMRMTSTMKHTWTQSVMNNAQYRMVIDLDEETVAVQVTDSPVAAPEPKQQGEKGLLSEEAREAENKQKAASTDPFRDGKSDPFGVYKAPTYENVEAAAFKGKRLKEGVEIDRVWTAYSEEPITKGKVGVNFHPDGFQQQVIIVLTDGEDNYYSIVNEPLTGRVKIHSKIVEPDDTFGEPVEVQE